ncbi:MAG: glucan 1,4-alpha-glucosidase [Proteobacteria bacterium]|nr:glucan 1,4-alpha-glucosidase [Pseudomonadota bacterium]MBU4295504.1 glucan 1,4-alpha-glucosidase [Pseudomonadota bacterium]MCG2749487.1 glucan 1,4-alpha-glucosidase [Desulfobulbaceae bacterium]
MMRQKTCSAFVVAVVGGLVAALSAFAGGGAPGAQQAQDNATWTYAGKTGIGTSFERYADRQYSDTGPSGPISRVWFSIAQGIITETAYGRIDAAQIKDLQFLVTGPDFFAEEKTATEHQIEYLTTDTAGRPTSLAYRVTNTDRDNRYVIEKCIFTDPDRQTLFIRVRFTASQDNITPHILINPHMANSGRYDVAYVGRDQQGRGYLNARQGHELFLSLRSTAPFARMSAGFVGASDGWQDLNDNRVMDWDYDYADDGGGNVAMMAKLTTLQAGQTADFDLAVGFGASHKEAMAAADASLAEGYEALLAKYNGAGSAVGWEDYLAGLYRLPEMIGATGDQGRLLYASAMVLKALEDKQNPGALIASLSIPWGDTTPANEYATGYRAVWPRDFYQCAMALLALGDRETPRVAFDYLPRVQVQSTHVERDGITIDSSRPGWFLQKTQVDGHLEWLQIQMDQTAMPIMLGWKLWKNGLLPDDELVTRYWQMLKPAAEFLANGGDIKVSFPGGSEEYTVQPPWTKMERWEEQAGYSPSTEAAIITGLITAADIARQVHDPGAAAWYEARADAFAGRLAATMFTTSGVFTGGEKNGRYYLRISKNDNPNDGEMIAGSNGRPAINEKKVLDAGFLELVRYGVVAANDPDMLDSLPELDAMDLEENLRVRYDFSFDGQAGFPGWRRYGNDGYGERTDNGGNYSGSNSLQRGRVWPIFTGERGHFELERLKAANNGQISQQQLDGLKQTYVRAMEYFANEGLMLPEQVFDGVGDNATHHYAVGEGTDSATPLAWSHAEYIKLVRSLADRNVWDSCQLVRDRYAPRFKHNFPTLFLRGTFNSWQVTPMTLKGDNTWQADHVLFGDGPEERFKFDLRGDWTDNYGDNPMRDRQADPFGADIPISQGAGTYTITFDEQTMGYQVTKE